MVGGCELYFSRFRILSTNWEEAQYLVYDVFMLGEQESMLLVLEAYDPLLS